MNTFVRFLSGLIICVVIGGLASFPQPARALIFLGDEHWTLQGSPYVIDSPKNILPGTSLIVDPGVEVVFTTGYLNIYGSVLLKGTQSQPIRVQNKNPQTIFNLLYDGASLNIKYSSITGDLSQESGVIVSAAEPSNISISSSTLEYGKGSALQVNNNSTLYISYSDIRNFTDKALEIKDSFAQIVETNIEMTGVGISSIDSEVHARNNWWGHATGPFSSTTQPFGRGVSISGTVDFIPWSTTRFRSENDVCCSSVLFIPGMQGSRLYKKERFFENQLWEPDSNEDIQKLFLTSAGTTKDSTIYTKDIIGTTNILGPVFSVPIYTSLITSLNSLVKDGSITTWQSLPYDWRMSQESLIDSSVISRITELASTSKTGKVTIVAHSNGGLLGKVIMKKLSDIHKDYLIDKIMFIAVPENGTPQTLTTLLHGDNQTLLFGFLMNKKMARDFSFNMSSVYTLVPSKKYFETNVDPEVIRFTSASTSMKFVYGDRIKDYDTLYDFFLASRGDRFKNPKTASDTNWPNILNVGLLQSAKQFHTTYDTWQPPAHVQFTTIAGTGKDTLKGIEYFISDCKTGSFIADILISIKCGLDNPRRIPMTSTNGDGVVTGGGIQYRPGNFFFVDLFGINVLEKKNYAHATMLNIPQVLQIIKDVIQNKTIQTGANIYPVVPHMPRERDVYSYTVSQEVDISVRDQDNKVTGAGTVYSSNMTQPLYEEIPNSSYFTIGDSKKITLAEKPTKVEIKGVSTGVFSLVTEAKVISSSTGSAYYRVFDRVPVTSVTSGTLVTTATTSQLELDDDSDGDIDRVIIPTDTTASSTNEAQLDLSMFRRRIASSSDDVFSLVTKRYLLRFDGIEGAALKASTTEAVRLTQITIDRIAGVIEDLQLYKGRNPAYVMTDLKQYSLLYIIFADLRNVLIAH
ncbi:MAG: hypothetical protein RL094_19 [Candidatus Parcubacteria bacterium]|jgi:hypothetical protein